MCACANELSRALYVYVRLYDAQSTDLCKRCYLRLQCNDLAARCAYSNFCCCHRRSVVNGVIQRGSHDEPGTDGKDGTDGTHSRSLD